MFNLEKSIAEWRQRMLAAGILSPVPLEELEGHLREEVGRQVHLGTPEPEAFEMAVQQMGPADALKEEFKESGRTKLSRLAECNPVYSAISLAGAAALISLLFICPPLSSADGCLYFSWIKFPWHDFYNFYYGLGLGATGVDEQRIDIPVWFVDVSVFMLVIETAILAFRRRGYFVAEESRTGDR